MLTQVSTAGGETAEIPTPFRNIMVQDISKDHSQLLVATAEGTHNEAKLWSVPLPSGSPRPIGNFLASSASWSPDGKQLVYTKGSAIYLANADGTDPRPLVTVQGSPRIRAFPLMETAFVLLSARKTELHQRFGRCEPTARICILSSLDGAILRQNAAAIGPLTGATIIFSASPQHWAMSMPCRAGRACSARPRWRRSN